MFFFFLSVLCNFSSRSTSGIHTFYMTCDQKCELWIQELSDLDESDGNQYDLTKESNPLIKLNDEHMRLLPLEWDR